MLEKNYEDLKNNENSKSDKDLQNLIVQIDELKDLDTSNDKIEGVFKETQERTEINKSLNEGLTKSLEQHPDETKIISGEIKKLFRNPNLKIDQDTKKSLEPLGDILDGIVLRKVNGEIPEDALIPDNAETLNNSPIDPEFLKTITYDEIKDFFINPKVSNKIKEEFIIQKDGKNYINFKGKILSTERDYNDESKNGDSIYTSGGQIVIGNKDCKLLIDDKKSNIINGNKQEIIYKNGKQIEITKNLDKTETRTSNGIDIKVSHPQGSYILQAENNPELKLSMEGNAHEKYYSITKFLSLKKDNSKEKCKSTGGSILQYGNTFIDLNFNDKEEIKNIVKRINNYEPKNDNIENNVSDSNNKIKENLIKEKNGEQYITIKGKNIKIADIKDGGLYDYTDKNVIIPNGSTVYLGNNNYMMTFSDENTEITDTMKGKTKTIYPDGEELTTTDNPDETQIRASHGIEVKSNYTRDNGIYHFYSPNNEELDISNFFAGETFCKIAKILSLKKDTKGECIAVDNKTIKYGNTEVEIKSGDAEKTAKRINSFK